MILNDLVKKSEVILPEIEKLITSTYLGANGARYQLQNSSQRLGELDHPLFLYMIRNNKVLGNITFCNRQNEFISENYIRYFAFDQKVQSNTKSDQQKKNGGIRKLLFQNLDRDIFNRNEKYIYYAHIDHENFKSLQMGSQFGFEEIGEFNTHLFSRFFPKHKLKIRELNQKELNSYINLLEKQYQHHNFCHLVNIPKGKTFGYFENQKLVNACTIHETSWKFKSLPGSRGKFKLKLMQTLPFTSKFFKKKEYRFLGIEGWYIQKPELINDFLESLLAQKKNHIAMWWADTNCPINNSFNEIIKYGFLNKISKNIGSKTLVKTNLKNVESYRNKPSYISSYDLS